MDPREEARATGSGRGFVATICLLFALSGAAALVFELVWLRLFARMLGVTQHATSAVLAAFMAGMALGAWLFGRVADRRRRPLALYGALEIGAGLAALAVPLLADAALPLYRRIAELYGVESPLLLVAKLALLGGLVLLPTALMGGTLPLLTVWLHRRGEGAARSVSLLYSWNTVGAVVGVIGAGFFLLDRFGERGALGIAVGTNLLVGVAALLVARGETAAEPRGPATTLATLAANAVAAERGAGGRRRVVVALGVSGFAALAYEVLWSRQLVLYLATSIYAFASMLAIFLAGLAFGSRAMHARLPRLADPWRAFAGVQVGVAAWAVAAAELFPILGAEVLSSLPDARSLAAAAALLFPLACGFGAALPLAVRLFASDAAVGRGLGVLYGVNTAGNVAGALAAGLLLLPRLGSHRTLLLLAAANAAVGAWLLASSRDPAGRRWPSAAVVLAAAAILVPSAWHRDPFLTLIANRVAAQASPDFEIHRNFEAIEGTVTAFRKHADRTTPGRTHLWINGVGMTHVGAETRLMAHLPLALAARRERALVICFGMGSTVRSALLHPGVEVTAVELVRELYDLSAYFVPDARDALASSRFRPVVGDGRNFLLLEEGAFDVIVVDPAPPIFSAGAVNLYTREFLTLARERLRPGGVLLLWLPRGTRLELLGIVRTFATVFPNTHVWRGPNGWGLFLAGLPDDASYDAGRLERFFAERPEIVRDMAEVADGGWSAASTGALHLWGPDEIARLAGAYPLLTDDFPYTEFPLFRDRALADFAPPAVQ